MGIQNEPKTKPFASSEELENHLFSLCFRSKRAPEGVPFSPKIGARIVPKMGSESGPRAPILVKQMRFPLRNSQGNRRRRRRFRPEFEVYLKESLRKSAPKAPIF